MVKVLNNNITPTGKVIWVTGLSGSGKTTVAELIYKKVILKNSNYVLLDGDKLREILLDENVPKSYELNSRVSLGLKYAKLCKLISDQNINVIISTISLYKDVFKYLDENILNHYKIYLNFSSEVLKSRNQKSLYSNFEVGQVSNVVGLDIVYDIPEADLTITDEMDGKIEIIVQLIIQKCELII